MQIPYYCIFILFYFYISTVIQTMNRLTSCVADYFHRYDVFSYFLKHSWTFIGQQWVQNCFCDKHSPNLSSLIRVICGRILIRIIWVHLHIIWLSGIYLISIKSWLIKALILSIILLYTPCIRYYAEFLMMYFSYNDSFQVYQLSYSITWKTRGILYPWWELDT